MSGPEMFIVPPLLQKAPLGCWTRVFYSDQEHPWHRWRQPLFFKK